MGALTVTRNEHVASFTCCLLVTSYCLSQVLHVLKLSLFKYEFYLFFFSFLHVGLKYLCDIAKNKATSNVEKIERHILILKDLVLF